MEEMINCKCEKCGVDYDKPASFKKWNEEYTNVFFRWSLAFCDKCRREKEIESLKSLPEIIKAMKITKEQIEQLKIIHEKIRSILIENKCEEHGDCIIDEISIAVGILPTTVYYKE